MKFIQENIVDVIFLDINIPMLDGMLLAKTINNLKKPKIVFITAYKEHAVDAFELEAFDYILKPYSDDRIISMLKKLEKSDTVNETYEVIEVTNETSKTSWSVSLWKNEKIIVVNIEDIYYCEAKERETIVYTKDDKYIVKGFMTEFEKNLGIEIFFKTHRSYIVNINKIKEIIPWFNTTYKLKLKDIDTEIPVSRSNIKEFRKIMHI